MVENMDWPCIQADGNSQAAATSAMGKSMWEGYSFQSDLIR